MVLFCSVFLVVFLTFFLIHSEFAAACVGRRSCGFLVSTERALVEKKSQRVFGEWTQYVLAAAKFTFFAERLGVREEEKGLSDFTRNAFLRFSPELFASERSVTRGSFPSTARLGAFAEGRRGGLHQSAPKLF